MEKLYTEFRMPRTGVSLRFYSINCKFLSSAIFLPLQVQPEQISRFWYKRRGTRSFGRRNVGNRNITILIFLFEWAFYIFPLQSNISRHVRQIHKCFSVLTSDKIFIKNVADVLKLHILSRLEFLVFPLPKTNAAI